MIEHDWVIHGGRVIDPANNIDDQWDLGINEGHISFLAKSIDLSCAKRSFDARGKIVVPGLIDLHFHGYEHATPLGVSVDHYCLGRGVTTAVDAGSSGCSTFPGFRFFLSQACRTRLLAFLNISSAGLAFALLGGDSTTPGELGLIGLVDLENCVECIESNRDLIVGVKIRLSKNLADNGKNEGESYGRALEAARAVDLPLMVHHTLSTIPLEDCPGKMEEGDIYTHTYHGYHSTIIQASNRQLDPVVWSARQKGILFDVGHGQGSFNWTVAELSLNQGFKPSTISTDLHSGTCEGPAYDLPLVMTKFLHLGLSLTEIINLTTNEPARAIGWEDRLGTLGIGREADVTVLSVDNIAMDLEDCHSQKRSIKQKITPHAVWRQGESAEITSPVCCPNPSTIERQRNSWEQAEVKDLQPPPESIL